MKLFASLLIAAALVAPVVSAHANEPAKVAKPDLAKGEASFTAVCAACHGADGNSGTPVNPKLAQQHPEYIVKQLQEFKSGKRANAVMSGMAATLSEDDMKNIAAWVGSKKAKTGFAKDKELVTLPLARAATRPMAQAFLRNTPACRANTPNTPRLS